MRMDKHPDAVAFDAFEEQRRELFDISTIGDTPQYLRNRLWYAFMAGRETKESEMSQQPKPDTISAQAEE